VKNFQEDEKIVIALLSITAAGVGLTLTASSTIVFTELHWTPGIMTQA
jgi:SWI/SNF-related matrix-associated actin-dependent regulator 1 of chromatin subfamily A